VEFEEHIIGVRKPERDILRTLESEYAKIGQNFGYVPVQSPLFLCLKKQGSQVGIEVQFGGPDAFEYSLKKLVQSGSDSCFLITSSRAHTLRLAEARSLLLRKFMIKNQKYLFVDIETGKVMHANSEWENFSKQVNRPDWARPGPMPLQPVFRTKKVHKNRMNTKNYD